MEVPEVARDVPRVAGVSDAQLMALRHCSAAWMSPAQAETRRMERAQPRRARPRVALDRNERPDVSESRRDLRWTDVETLDL